MGALGTRVIARRNSRRCTKQGAAMKKLVVAGVAFVALAAGPAMAADMPVKAMPAPIPGVNWSGIYVGLHGGGGWARTSYASDFNCAVGVLCENANIDGSGWVLGGQIGYRWQINHVVLGAEIAAAAADINGNTGST